MARSNFYQLWDTDYYYNIVAYLHTDYLNVCAPSYTLVSTKRSC